MYTLLGVVAIYPAALFSTVKQTVMRYFMYLSDSNSTD